MPTAARPTAVVSSPATGGGAPGAIARSQPPTEEPREGHELVGTGPAVAGPTRRTGVGGFRMTPLPVQPAKLHAPPPRDDTLSRERLNAWLERAAGGRLGLIVAEAGFGKTTLLADWALRTRRQTTWYRLEPDDRDWLTFIRHLVAGGRELDPEFAPETFRLLHALGPGGPTPADLATSIARELAAFGAASPTGLTLIVDDYHVVDGHPETDPIMRAVLDRTGPGFSVVVATRSTPRFSLGRLRARGGVMTIDGEALCFDMAETGRLFRDAYQRPLDEDLVSDLHERTEGWPALLTLVRTGIEDRATVDPRALIDGLQASRGDLYEFLAEEVMGTLPPELQHFLTRVSVLRAVDVEMATLVDDRPAEAIAAAIRECERLGLLTRPDRESPHRFHHLVREFLMSRLTAEIGEPAVRDLHRSIADQLRDTDWYGAAWHYLMAGDADACAAVVDSALDEIIASGLFEQVRPFLRHEAGDPDRAVALILRSRAELARSEYHLAVILARRADGVSPSGRARATALLNLAAVLAFNGPNEEALEYVGEALRQDLSPSQRTIAEAYLAMWGGTDEGSLIQLAEQLRAMAERQELDGHLRYVGVSRANLAGTLIWLCEFEGALREAGKAETAHGGLANLSVERVAATALRAVALAYLGRLEAARATAQDARATGSHLAARELAVEVGRFEVELGSLDHARSAAGQLIAHGTDLYMPVANLTHALVALRAGDPKLASKHASELNERPVRDAAGKLRRKLVDARIALALDDPGAPALASDAQQVASSQETLLGQAVARILVGVAGSSDLDDAVRESASGARVSLSLLAEEMARCLDRLSQDSRELVRTEAELRPERWRSALRLAIDTGASGSHQAASLLALIGSSEDAAFLRAVAGTQKPLRSHAMAITERLAPNVVLYDLGAVEVRVGDRTLGRAIRRKVLAMLTFLASRPRLAANREEILETLWPELSPEAAGNSLHQAIYHLRRVLEPDFREWASANYISVDGDVVSLNSHRVRSISRRCWELLADPNNDSSIDSLVDHYSARYALDFAYDDWAADYRETLHAAVLGAVESAMRTAIASENFARAIRMGQAVMALDPQADSVELELLRAYKRSGRQAAAAEQYAHYAAFVREELGTEPPPYGEV